MRYTFPQDGDYEFRLRLGRTGHTDAIVGLAERSDIEVSIDGERVQLFTVGGQSGGAAGRTRRIPMPRRPRTGRPGRRHNRSSTDSSTSGATGPKPAVGDLRPPRPSTASGGPAAERRPTPGCESACR